MNENKRGLGDEEHVWLGEEKGMNGRGRHRIHREIDKHASKPEGYCTMSHEGDKCHSCE